MKQCTDHLGNEYPSITAMCKAYNIPTQTYGMRIKQGWSVKDALTTPKGEPRLDTPDCVHLWMNEDLFNRLDSQSKKDHRSKTGIIELALEQYFAELDRREQIIREHDEKFKK
jgi:hypothetical protein